MPKTSEFFFLKTSDFSRNELDDMTHQYMFNFLSGYKIDPIIDSIIGNKIFLACLSKPLFLQNSHHFFKIDNQKLSYSMTIKTIKKILRPKLIKWILDSPEMFISDPGKTHISFAAYFILTSRQIWSYNSFALFKDPQHLDFDGFWIVNPYNIVEKNQFNHISTLFMSLHLNTKNRQKTIKIKDISGLLIQHINDFCPSKGLSIDSSIIELSQKRMALKDSIELKLFSLFFKKVVSNHVNENNSLAFQSSIKIRKKLNLKNLAFFLDYINSIKKTTKNINDFNNLFVSLFFENFFTDEFSLSQDEMLFLLTFTQSVEKFTVPTFSPTFSHIFLNKNLINALMSSSIPLILDSNELNKPIQKKQLRHHKHISFFRGLSNNKTISAELTQFLKTKSSLINTLFFLELDALSRNDNKKLTNSVIFVPLEHLKKLGISERESISYLNLILNQQLFFFKENNTFYSLDESVFTQFLKHFIFPLNNLLSFLAFHRDHHHLVSAKITREIFFFINEFLIKRIESQNNNSFPFIKIKFYLDSLKTIIPLCPTDSFIKMSFERVKYLSVFEIRNR